MVDGTFQGPPDRVLSTLAILKVNAERGRGHLDNYLPFIYHCLAASKTEAVSTKDLQAQLKNEFDIDLPQGVLKRLLTRAESDGKMRHEHGVHIPNHNALAGCDLAAERAMLERGHRHVVDELRRLALERYALTWDERRAAELLMRYVDGFSSRVLSAAVSGTALPAPHELSEDDFVVHRFATHVYERDPDLFDHLVNIVKGRMLADAFYYLPEAEEHTPSLGEVEVYLDGPLLLHLLGYAGEEIRAPYVELLDMLKRQEAIVRCFEHNVTEAQEILDAAARRVGTGQINERFHGDVVSHLVRSGKSRTEVELLSERLPRDLLKLGVQPVATPRRDERLQPDEERLAATLQSKIKYVNPRARDRDLDSLTAIHRLRKGRTYRDIAKSKAVLVAHNYGLFRVSAMFFRSGGRAIPPCLYDSAFITLVWLREPIQSPELPREQVLAHAYAALNPDDRLWQTFNEEIDRLREDNSIEEEDAHFLRFADESRESLMDHTRGNPDSFTEGSVPQILERSRELAKAELKAELVAERRAHRVTTGRLTVTRKRINSIAYTAGTWVASSLFAGVLSAVVVGMIFGPIGPIDTFVPGGLQIACAATAIIVGLLTIIYRPPLLELRDRVATDLARRFEGVLARLLRLDPD